MSDGSRKLRIAGAATILVLAIARLATDKNHTDAWVYIVGVVLGLVLVALIVWFAVRKTRRKLQGLQPALDQIRGGGSTAYAASKGMDSDFFVVSIDRLRDLTVQRYGRKGPTTPPLSLPQGAYTLSRGSEPGARLPVLRLDMPGGRPEDYQILPDGAGVQLNAQERIAAQQAVDALIAAAG